MTRDLKLEGWVCVWVQRPQRWVYYARDDRGELNSVAVIEQAESVPWLWSIASHMGADLTLKEAMAAAETALVEKGLERG